MSKADLFLAEYERELTTTRRFLERIPGDRLAWKPHEKSMSVGQLAHHIAETPEMVLRTFVRDEVTPPDLSTSRLQPPTLSAVLQTLESGAVYVREALPKVNDHQMAALVGVVVAGRTLMSSPREVFIRSIMFNHWYHHRGQLGVYLRLLGVSVPVSYGPSGDESPF
ncbi:MAG TPA: DinB family protein [Phycisphaerales bacterium]|nr:DinB family protein [Phycisphaerales bacterium]